MSTMTLADARARFESRFAELQGRAKHYFADYKPEAKDEAVANSLFLAWHDFVALVRKGKADDAMLTSTFYFACRKTRSGRMLRSVRGDKSRDVYVRSRGNPGSIVNGIDYDGFVSSRIAVPDVVAFRVDTRAWLDSLTEHQRRRALDLAEGTGTKELAERWNVSTPAVSLYRRQLHESYQRFVNS